MDQEKEKAGRPFIFTDPNDLKLKIQTYFDMCDPHLVTATEVGSHRDDGKAILITREVMTQQRVYTVTGLALHLGVSRDTLRNYTNPEHYSDEIPAEVRQELIRTIAEAFQRVEEFNEQALFNGNPNGVKFNLVNNFGWVDRTDVTSGDKPIPILGAIPSVPSDDSAAEAPSAD